MTDKQLKSKAIEIKGNEYVLVSDRIIFFNENYENGCIKTALVSDSQADMVVVKAQVIPNIETPDRYFTGYSQAKWGEGMVNKTAALENAETSAVGRALAMMGIGVIDSVASVDEIKKATGTKKKATETKTSGNFETKIIKKGICPIHHTETKLFQKGGPDGPKWWGHKMENGKWCNAEAQEVKEARIAEIKKMRKK